MSMKINANRKLTLSSPFFDEMRRDLDIAIRKAVYAMEKKDISSSAIALKIDISTLRSKIKDENSPTGERVALIPGISYKLATTMQAKAETKGNVVGSGHELIQDDLGDYYVVTKEEASGQLNMFNGYDELPNEDDGPVPDEDGVPDLDAENFDLAGEDDE